MEISENDINLAKMLIRKAVDDLKSAKVLLKNGQYADSTYHSQQCAEKIVKAFLVLKQNFVADHLVSGVLRRVVRKNERWNSIITRVQELEKHWIKPRYPFIGKELIWDPTKEYTKEIAKQALEKAEFVLNALKKLLKDKYGVSIEKSKERGVKK